VFQDRTLTCRDCAGEFTFSSGEQSFFASKGLLNDPQRCPSCRAVAKRARAVGGPREFHAAICGSCGGQAMVPFAPRNDRPVYCSTCFDKVRAGEQPVSATVCATESRRGRHRAPGGRPSGRPRRFPV
jgi:CxxC-x17-CxxC domain-containing protein